jgi:hypothetical protein
MSMPPRVVALVALILGTNLSKRSSLILTPIDPHGVKVKRTVELDEGPLASQVPHVRVATGGAAELPLVVRMVIVVPPDARVPRDAPGQVRADPCPLTRCWPR